MSDLKNKLLAEVNKVKRYEESSMEGGGVHECGEGPFVRISHVRNAIKRVLDRTQPEAAAPAQDLSAAIDKDAKIAAQRARIMELEEQLARALETPVNDWCPECHARESSGDALSAGDRVDAGQINFSVYDDPRFKKLTDALYMTGFHQAGSGDREVKALADYVDARNCQSIKDAERWRFRQKFLLDGGAVLWSQRGCQYRNAQGAIICQGGTEEEAIDAAILQSQKGGSDE